MSEDLSERTFKFTCDVYDFCEKLADKPGLPRRVAYQLFDAAGSVGANFDFHRNRQESQVLALERLNADL
jgi:hypothetical protein